MAKRKTPYARWSEPELTALETIGNQHPVQRVAELYNLCAAQNRWPKRSLNAIEHKLSELAGTVSPVVDGWNSWAVARELGVSKARVQHWVRRGDLPCRRVSRNLVIYRDDLVALARRKPHLFGGIDEERLLWMLEDPLLVDQIRRQHPRAVSQLEPRQIIRPLDGRTWRSGVELAAELGVSEQSVYLSLKRGYRCRGHRYCYLDDFRQYPERYREVS